MRAISKPVALQWFDVVRPVLTLDPGAKSMTLDELIVRRLDTKDYSYDPSTPEALRWSSEDYLSFRKKVLAAFASAEVVYKEDPTKFPSRTTAIDFHLYTAFRDGFPVTPFEAGIEGVWEYLSIAVLPDLVLIRHRVDMESADDETAIRQALVSPRFSGGERNSFRRIWIRSFATRDEPNLLDGVLEDNLVAIFERVRVSQNPRVAKSILRTIQTNPHNVSSGLMESTVRDLLKRIVLVMSVKSLDVLPEHELDSLISGLFKVSADAISSVRA